MQASLHICRLFMKALQDKTQVALSPKREQSTVNIKPIFLMDSATSFTVDGLTARCIIYIASQKKGDTKLYLKSSPNINRF